ncbi:MAG TPA: NHLP bacteriocin export ABC transporter permease/ATPase subunit [Terriglobales bacterium]|nr:NHLP bacteriocin export ABC transporter permease/ATPase subunit [Terriglobales bacterium]
MPSSSGAIDLQIQGKQLSQLGVVEEPLSNVPFAVQNTGSVWIVERGSLDLFLVSVANGGTGARYPVMRIEQGDAVFGLGVAVPGNRQFIAVASSQTRLLHLSPSTWSGLVSLCSQESVLRLLERWISQLSSAVAGGSCIDSFLVVEAGAAFTISEKAKAIVTQDGIVWAALSQGKAHFLSQVAVPCGSQQFFPVSRRGWLELAPESVVRCIDSQALCQIDPEGRSLQSFHSVAIACVIEKQIKESAKEEERQRAKSAADGMLIRDALSGLAAPLGKAIAVVEGEVPVPDPVYLAAATVGKRMKIRIKPHPDMLRGMKLLDPVAAIARASGVRVRRVQLKGNWWKQDNGPLLAFRDADNRPLALLPRSARSYEVYDPVEQRTQPVTAQESFSLASFAYTFYRPFPAKKLSLSELLKFGISGCSAHLVTIALMGMAAGLLSIVTPYTIGIAFNSLIPSAEKRELLHMVAILFAITIAAAMFTLTRTFAVLRLQGRMDNTLQAAVWDRLVSLPVPFFRDYTSGDLASRSLAIEDMSEIVTGSTLNVILSGIFSVFSMALLFYYSWELALLAVAFVFCACLVSAFCIYLQVGYQREMVRMGGRISGVLLELITGIAKFRVAAAEKRAFTRWAREFGQQKQISVQARRLSNRLNVLNMVLPTVGLAVIFYYNAILQARPQAKQIPTGDLVGFVVAFTQFLVAALAVSSTMQSVLGIVPLYERAKPILHTLPEVAEARCDPGKLAGGIEASHLVFRYRPGTPAVLQDFCIKILPGQFVAIIGPSGSGKSTLFRLLLGFETPESGTIYFDEQDLAGLDVQAVRRQMGVVLQTSRLVSGSIFTNIVGSAPLTVGDAWDAAALAGLDADIRRMPMGMHTFISEGSGGISGGQRQRLMIARAIVGKPKILLMDEATSALDNETQAIVSRSLESLRSTRIVIAHRLSTIINADRIFVMAKGTVVQAGTYQELLQQEGLFRELASRQLT